MGIYFIQLSHRDKKRKKTVSVLSKTLKSSSNSLVVNSSCNEQKTNAGKTLMITHRWGFLFALFKTVYIAINYIIKEMNYSGSSRQKEEFLYDLITHTLILFKCFFSSFISSILKTMSLKKPSVPHPSALTC